MTSADAGTRTVTVLVGGHESSGGADLARLTAAIPRSIHATPGRDFHNLVSGALDRGDRVVAVPMTFGRDVTMIADAAKTLRWVAAEQPSRVALAAPFAQSDHLVAQLRTVALRSRPQGRSTALLLVAAPSNPFDEAELHRLAYLVATHGAITEVGVAIAADSAGVAASADRLRKLGATRVVAVPAGFAADLPSGAYPDHLDVIGPLMSDAAVAAVVRARVRDALELLDDGSDGIATGLEADHGHGYAHSHAFERAQSAAESGAGSRDHHHALGRAHHHSHSHVRHP